MWVALQRASTMKLKALISLNPENLNPAPPGRQPAVLRPGGWAPGGGAAAAGLPAAAAVAHPAVLRALGPQPARLPRRARFGSLSEPHRLPPVRSRLLLPQGFAMPCVNPIYRPKSIKAFVLNRCLYIRIRVVGLLDRCLQRACSGNTRSLNYISPWCSHEPSKLLFEI